MNESGSKSGFVLAELLNRRPLQVDEVIDLLDSLPEQLDSDETLRDASLLREMRVNFERHLDPPELNNLINSTTAEWPHFTLSPKDVGGETIASGQTAIAREEAMLHRSPPGALASLIYQLLAGRQRPDITANPPQIDALGQDANDLLQRALALDQSKDAKEFWREFVAACRMKPGAQRSPRSSTATPAERQPGTVCKLAPVGAEAAAIHLVTGSSFRIGRSKKRADFVTRFLPANPENAELTSKLSRVHALLELHSEGVTLRDGDGTTPSRNGSSFRDAPLSSECPSAMGRGGLLSLGSHYRLQVTALPIARSAVLIGKERFMPRPEGAPEDIGAVILEPLDEPHPILHAAWLFDAAGFFLGPSGEFRWHRDPAMAAQALFLTRNGSFQLGNVSLSRARLLVDGRELKLGDIVPLRSGQSVTIGHVNFTVSVS